MSSRPSLPLPPGHAGTMLREARKVKGLLQWQVARDAGISGARLSTLETGTVRVRPCDAALLAPLLGLDAADLMRAAAPLPQEPPAVIADWREPSVRSFRDIPASCPCDWAMTFDGPRPSGWAVAREVPGCVHHKAQASGKAA